MENPQSLILVWGFPSLFTAPAMAPLQRDYFAKEFGALQRDYFPVVMYDQHSIVSAF